MRFIFSYLSVVLVCIGCASVDEGGSNAQIQRVKIDKEQPVTLAKVADIKTDLFAIRGLIRFSPDKKVMTYRYGNFLGRQDEGFIGSGAYSLPRGRLIQSHIGGASWQNIVEGVFPTSDGRMLWSAGLSIPRDEQNRPLVREFGDPFEVYLEPCWYIGNITGADDLRVVCGDVASFYNRLIDLRKATMDDFYLADDGQTVILSFSYQVDKVDVPEFYMAKFDAYSGELLQYINLTGRLDEWAGGKQSPGGLLYVRTYLVPVADEALVHIRLYSESPEQRVPLGEKPEARGDYTEIAYLWERDNTLREVTSIKTSKEECQLAGARTVNEIVASPDNAYVVTSIYPLSTPQIEKVREARPDCQMPLNNYVRLSPVEESVLPEEVVGKRHRGPSAVLSGGYHLVAEGANGSEIFELRDISSGALLNRFQLPGSGYVKGQSTDGCLVAIPGVAKKGVRIQVYAVQGGASTCQ